MKDKLRRLSRAIGSVLRKSKRTNDSLEAFRETESFKQLESAFRKAIVKQAKWVSKNIHQLDSLYEQEGISDSEFEAKVSNWIGNNMPSLADLISAVRVYTYFYNAFEAAVLYQYQLQGIMTKGADFTIAFKLTNQGYIAELKNMADYLLHRSRVNDSTLQNLMTIFRDSRLEQKTIDETAAEINDRMPDIAENRAFMIANTESNRAMSTAQQAFMKENQVPTKSWIPAGPNTCPICDGNADDGEIGIDETFSSGDLAPPAHPNCECYEEAGKIDLDNVDLWGGD